jgi:GNAT superfamily N-acetyltransferase
MTEDVELRRARDTDTAAAYAVFRRAIFQHLHKVGLATEAEALDPPIASAWKRQEGWIRHFWATAAENWVAVDRDQTVVGWALSVERGGHLELTHFFVAPDASGGGIGRALLARAMPPDRCVRSSIVATQDPSALSLYLKSGLRFVTTSVDIVVKARALPSPSTLQLRRADDADLAVITSLEAEILGLRRDVDILHLLANRPAWIAERDGRPVGYAFGAQPIPPDATDFLPTCGPMAALDHDDLPGLLDWVVATAPTGGDIAMCVPLINDKAVRHLLSLGGMIDPFYVAILSTEGRMSLDRYIHTSPTFIL